MTFIDRLTRSVTQILKKARGSGVETLNKEIIKPVKMRASTLNLAKAVKYVPSIKFVGGPHPVVTHSAADAGLHPCTVDSLRPGAPGCSTVEEVAKKWLPFKVVPYVNSNKSASGKGSSTKAAGNSPKYVFKNRPLEENEVGSISQLPPRFKLRPMDEQEIEIINGGGI